MPSFKKYVQTLNQYLFAKYFRLISEKTVEENILKKANQKRLMSDVAIEGGNFTTAFFKQVKMVKRYSLTTPNALSYSYTVLTFK